MNEATSPRAQPEAKLEEVHGRLATLLQTAKMNGVDPFAWLAQTLQRIAAGWPNRELDQLLPLNHHAG
jgi:hypothetical protein